jgi:hypothetical protein
VIWLNPAAWVGLLAIAGPIVIHILVQRKAERLAFPSLRFLQQGRLASIRRHLLDDVLLLAIRAAIVAAAVAALAGPLIVTRTQRQAWNARVARAIVVQGSDGPRALQPSAFLSQTFETPAVADAIPRAVAWLEDAPPARRELLIVGPLALGSVSADDLATIPPGIGVRFEQRRRPAGPSAASLAAVCSRWSATLPCTLWSAKASDQGGKTRIRRRSAAGDAERFSHKRAETGAAAASDAFPVERRLLTDARPIVDAAIAAVRSQRVWVPAAKPAWRLVLLDRRSIRQPSWMDERSSNPGWRDAVASIARDRDLQAAGAQTPAGLSDPRFSAMSVAAVAPGARRASRGSRRRLQSEPRRRQRCAAVQSRHTAVVACDG